MGPLELGSPILLCPFHGLTFSSLNCIEMTVKAAAHQPIPSFGLNYKCGWPLFPYVLIQQLQTYDLALTWYVSSRLWGSVWWSQTYIHTDFHFNFPQCFKSSINRAEIQTQIFLFHSTIQTKTGQWFFMNWGSESRSGYDS